MRPPKQTSTSAPGVRSLDSPNQPVEMLQTQTVKRRCKLDWINQSSLLVSHSIRMSQKSMLSIDRAADDHLHSGVRHKHPQIVDRARETQKEAAQELDWFIQSSYGCGVIASSQSRHGVGRGDTDGSRNSSHRFWRRCWRCAGASVSGKRALSRTMASRAAKSGWSRLAR